jgi:hypothetical protein
MAPALTNRGAYGRLVAPTLPVHGVARRGTMGGATQGGIDMQANTGDRIVIKGHKVGQPERQCEVLEVRGSDGGSPYYVRWDDGTEGLIYPGSDATVTPAPAPSPSAARRRRRNAN